MIYTYQEFHSIVEQFHFAAAVTRLYCQKPLEWIQKTMRTLTFTTVHLLRRSQRACMYKMRMYMCISLT